MRRRKRTCICTITRVYRYKLRVSRAVVALLRRYLETQRRLYNRALAERVEYGLVLRFLRLAEQDSDALALAVAWMERDGRIPSLPRLPAAQH